MSNRSGFTLVEVIVAVLLLDVGLLALVAGSAVVVRQSTELRARTAATQAVDNRLQLLGSGPCVAQSGTAVSASGLRESWQVTVPGSGTRDIRDSAAFLVAGSARSVVLRTMLPC